MKGLRWRPQVCCCPKEKEIVVSVSSSIVRGAVGSSPTRVFFWRSTIMPMFLLWRNTCCHPGSLRALTRQRQRRVGRLCRWTGDHCSKSDDARASSKHQFNVPHSWDACIDPRRWPLRLRSKYVSGNAFRQNMCSRKFLRALSVSLGGQENVGFPRLHASKRPIVSRSAAS